MNRTHRRTASRLLASLSLLLLLGCLIVLPEGADLSATGTTNPGLTDGAMPDAGTAPTTTSPPRRLNSSLSMPYFSFAQSLNSRS